jgi:hypothetical protein
MTMFHNILIGLVAALAVLVAIDRKQTLAFLVIGVREANPIAAAVMERFRTDAEGYLPGARIYFALAFVALVLLTALAVLLPMLTAAWWRYVPLGLMALWLPLQIACVWSNWKNHDKWFKKGNTP